MKADLNEVLVFARVAQAASFTKAARALGLPKSTVSRRIAGLEARLGARLVQRTTRRLSLTDAGRLFYEHCAVILTELETAELAVSRLRSEPRGLLRVTAPLNIEFLAPILATFLDRYPEVDLDVAFTDRVVDVVDESYDVAIRGGPLRDTGLIARHLGVMRSYLVASPRYLDRRGRPAEPAALAEHAGLVFAANRTWRLRSGTRGVDAPVRVRICANDFDMLLTAALGDLGVALVPAFRCVEALAAGRLERVLPDWSSPDMPLSALYSSTRHLSPAVRAFVDHLAERLTPPPWEAPPAS